MPPKTEKRKASVEEKAVSLEEAINTGEWKCTVTLLQECSPGDAVIAKIFAESAATCSRKEIKSISFDDVTTVIKQFMSGEVSSRYGYLLNFSSIFAEAAEYVRYGEAIPATLLAKIVRAMVLLAKKSAFDRYAKEAECKNDPIEIMASRAAAPTQQTTGTAADRDGKHADKSGKEKATDKRKPQAEATSTTRATPRVRLSTIGKEDTKLLKRGEISKNIVPIYDAPENGYFQLYVALLGFHEPELALEMVKADIPLHSVVCLDTRQGVASLASRTSVSKAPHSRLDKFWDHFLAILWNPDNTRYFRDVIFQVYQPKSLPSDPIELKDFIYSEISYLLYDLSDFESQLIDYLKHMQLWDVEDRSEAIPVLADFAEELDRMPHECLDMTVLLQYIFDNICDEDFEEPGEMQLLPEGSPGIHTPSSYMSDLKEEQESTLSFASLIPFQSTIKLPTPRWSNLVNSDFKQTLYNKIRALDLLYGLEDPERYWGEVVEAKTSEPCASKKRRLHCPNLEAEMRYQTGGLVSRYWDNYPRESAEDLRSTWIDPRVRFPEFNVNYFLYIVWISKMERRCLEELPRARKVSDASVVPDGGTTRFTITDCSRTALEKSMRAAYGKDFFLPDELKVVPPEMMLALSSPELRPIPKITWTYKAFVSDSHIPRKYLEGTALNVFDDLRRFLGDDNLSAMQDYDFVEELSSASMIRRIDDLIEDYDCVYHSYSPLTDSIYVFAYDKPSHDGIYREAYNVSLRTPVGLRDFYDYVVDDEKDWLEARKAKVDVAASERRRREQCPNTLYHPTPNFRDFLDSDFWIEGSIKYKSRAESGGVDAALRADKTAASEPTQQAPRSAKDAAKAKKKGYESDGSVHGRVGVGGGGDAKFVGFDISDSAVQFSGVKSVYRAVDGCSVEVSLQERLYGTQELGIHVRKGGHALHLYSYVCPEPHIKQPYTCHVEYRNGAIVAFSRRVHETFIETEGEIPRADKAAGEAKDVDALNTLRTIPLVVEDSAFAYDMKLSLPNGLTVATVRKHVQPCYIKQSYVTRPKNATRTVATEKSRLFLPNGSIIKMMSDNTVEVLKCDTSVVTASFAERPKAYSENDTYVEEDVAAADDDDDDDDGGVDGDGDGDGDDGGSPWFFASYSETLMNGYHYVVEGERVTSTTRYHIFKNADLETQSKYFRRSDGTNYVMLVDGTVCVEFCDGSKICCEVYEEDFYPEFDYDDDDDGDGDDFYEGMSYEVFVLVHRRLIMEHPEYATAIFDGRDRSWRLLLPQNSAVEVSRHGTYRVELDERTEFDIDTEKVSMWRHKGERFVMRTLANLSVFREGSPHDAHYCLSIDSTGKTFVVDKYGQSKILHECLLNRDDTSSVSCVPESEDAKKLKRYFVVRRDFSGFEIVHARTVKEEFASLGPGDVAFCQEVDSVIGRRYITLLREAPDTGNKWLVKSITPDTRYKTGIKAAVTSTTYGKPPSWMHPFPKKKKRIAVPEVLSARVLLEIHPTDCPPPPRISGSEVAFCDVSDLPEPTIPLAENPQEVMKRIAEQDQVLLREIYVRAILQRVQSNKLQRPCGNANLDRYLRLSAYHVNLRESLKKAIRFKIIPRYFSSPPGMAWLIIQSVIERSIRADSAMRAEKAAADAAAAAAAAAAASRSDASSEIEYNLEWASEGSCSDLSYRSNLSHKTAPAAVARGPPVCRHLLPTPRRVKSEPGYAMEYRTDVEKGGKCDDPLSVPSSNICVFTKEDLLELEKRNPPDAREPSEPRYEIQDLIRLGLV